MIRKLESIKFPQYRRYLNCKSYFKVISLLEFEEVQIIGTKKIVTTHEVKILPDRNFVMDLLLEYDKFAELIDAVEYETLMK